LGDHVFPGQKPGKPLSNMAMLGLLKDIINRDDSGKPRWVDPKNGRPVTPHGLRATFRTWGEDAGFPRDLLEESLGHQIRDRGIGGPTALIDAARSWTPGLDSAPGSGWAEFCRGKRAKRAVFADGQRIRPWSGATVR
jgi:hypothetical protein